MDKTQSIQTGLAKRTHLDKFDASLHGLMDQMRILAMGPMLANKRMRDTLGEALEPAREAIKVGLTSPMTEDGKDVINALDELYNAVRCALNDNDSADADTAARIKQMGKD